MFHIILFSIFISIILNTRGSTDLGIMNCIRLIQKFLALLTFFYSSKIIYSSKYFPHLSWPYITSLANYAFEFKMILVLIR